MLILAAALGLLNTPPSSPPTGRVSVEVNAARAGEGDDELMIRLINQSDQPVALELRDSPCSSTELATLAFVGKGAIGLPLERVGLPLYELPRKKVLPPGGVHTCTYAISSWYDGRWKSSDRPEVRIFWSFEPLEPGIYDKPLYGGVVRLITTSDPAP